jgi:hypothetical protein
MDTNTQTFCDMIRNRTGENRRAMHCFFPPHCMLSPAYSILRQELDSMIRVIYLLSIKSLKERSRLIQATLHGKKWKVQTSKNKWKNITDRDMVQLSQKLRNWTQSVYQFGCAYIHLSDYHNYLAENPFNRLSEPERQNILSHLRNYHGGPCNDNPDIKELASYIPLIFDKIASNLDCYLKRLEQDEILEIREI